MFIVDLDELHLGELFEVLHQRARDGIERAIRLTTACEIHMRNTISKCQFAITRETVGHNRESLIAFDITWTFEVFIERSANKILRWGDIPRHWDFIRKLPSDQTVVICEVDIDLHVFGRASRQRR
jgi:hypothetical protein